MRNNCPKRQSGAQFHTLSKLNDVSVGLVPLPRSLEAVYFSYRFLIIRLLVIRIKNRPGCLFIRTFFTEEFL